MAKILKPKKKLEHRDPLPDDALNLLDVGAKAEEPEENLASPHRNGDHHQDNGACGEPRPSRIPNLVPKTNIYPKEGLDMLKRNNQVLTKFPTPAAVPLGANFLELAQSSLAAHNTSPNELYGSPPNWNRQVQPQPVSHELIDQQRGADDVPPIPYCNSFTEDYFLRQRYN